ncbi:MAG: methionine--tRNA ligase [Candidatus Brocadiia bacterium]
MSNKKFYITTPIYYLNAEPHIGTAYTTIAADVMARYRRMCGDDVFFLTGTDEHGQKIARAAQQTGLSPKEFTDRLAPKFKEAWKRLNLSYDFFIRTTDPAHESAVKALFQKIHQNGDIYKGKYSGWYCSPCERYISLKESPDKKCPVCQREGEYFEEENYFFKLSKYQGKLLEHLKNNPQFIEPSYRYNEIFNRVESGMEDVSVSRAELEWGIPLPNDPSQVIWVWFDALINYISALGYPNEQGKYREFWPADVHLIAKDILWFHSVIWPCLLMSAGLPLPKKVFAHGWWTMNRDKISKSKGNVIYPADVIAKVGIDGLRYFLMKEIPFGLDGDFSYPALYSRYNNELGNDLGNLLLRTLTMLEKYFDGKIPTKSDPKFTARVGSCGVHKHGDVLKAEMVMEHLDRLEFHLALEEIWSIIRESNKFIDVAKPWTMAKNKSPELPQVMYTLAETIRIVAVLIAPFMPDTAKSIILQLGLAGAVPKMPQDLQWGGLSEGLKTSKGVALFPRIEDAGEAIV